MCHALIAPARSETWMTCSTPPGTISQSSRWTSVVMPLAVTMLRTSRSCTPSMRSIETTQSGDTCGLSFTADRMLDAGAAVAGPAVFGSFMVVCSVVASNFLPHARVLADSLAEWHPEARLDLFVTDECNG